LIFITILGVGYLRLIIALNLELGERTSAPLYEALSPTNVMCNEEKKLATSGYFCISVFTAYSYHFSIRG
jgi:hypothetical protein